MTTSESNLLKKQVIEGKNINLRIAGENDAAFILKLRLDPQLNKFIGETNPDVELQKEWIKNTYAKTTDFHYIIEDKKGNPYGTIAVYNINYLTGEAEWGRWVIKPESPAFFSIESNGLAFFVAFRKLGLKKLSGGANNENKKVVSFHKMYTTISDIDEEHTWFYVEESNYQKYLRIFKSFHNDVPEITVKK